MMLVKIWFSIIDNNSFMHTHTLKTDLTSMKKKMRFNSTALNSYYAEFCQSASGDLKVKAVRRQLLFWLIVASALLKATPTYN